MLGKRFERLKERLVGSFVVPPVLVEQEEKCIRRHAIVIDHSGMAMPIIVRGSMPLISVGPQVGTARGGAYAVQRLLPRSGSAYLGRRRRQMTDLQYQRYLNIMMANLKKWYEGQSDPKGVLIVIYGGNEVVRKTIDISLGLYERIKKDGYYPIFINWDSDLLRAYNEQLWRIRSGRYAPWYAARTAPFYLAGDLAKSFAHLVPALVLYGRLLWDASRWSRHATTEDLDRIQNPTVALGAWKPGREAQRALQIIGTSWFQALVLLGVGLVVPRAWENLLRRTRAMFRAPREFDPRIAPGGRVLDESTYHPYEGAMAVFLDALAETVQECPGMKVSVIAHSMGSMIANEALHYKSDLPYDSIVYTAPACSVREFARAVCPIVAKTGTTEAYVLTLHPRVEAGQRDWRGWIGGSVLEWLEGVLTPPHTYLDRMLGKWDNALRTLHVYEPSVREHIHIKSFSFDGHNPQMPCKHIDFDDPKLEPPFWRREFWV